MTSTPKYAAMSAERRYALEASIHIDLTGDATDRPTDRPSEESASALKAANDRLAEEKGYNNFQLASPYNASLDPYRECVAGSGFSIWSPTDESLILGHRVAVARIRCAISEEAKSLSKATNKPVLLALLAPEDCGDTKSFLPTLERLKAAFGDALIVSESHGSQQNRDGNSDALKEALAHFSYDKTPGDTGGNQRGHFPSGALYVDGKEVYRLPSDSALATMQPKTLADAISQATGVAYDSKKLHARGDIPLK